MSQIHNLKTLEEKINQVLLSLEKKLSLTDLNKINLLLLEEIKIDYFGAKTAIKYVVNVKKGYEGAVYLYPFDSKLLPIIYNAINDFNTQWRVSIQRERICLNLAIITTEKKDKIIKMWKLETEKFRIHIRSLRQSFLNYCKNILQLSNEELVSKQKEVQKIILDANHQIEQILKKRLDSFKKV